MINFKFYLPFADYVKGKVFAYTILIEYNRNKGENFMFLIVGLGNVGKEYDNTRHNIGFQAIDYIAANIGTEKFPRVKIGIGQPNHDLVSHVLGKFTSEESEVLNKVIPVCSDAVAEMIKKSVKDSMNIYNGFKVD